MVVQMPAPQVLHRDLSVDFALTIKFLPGRFILERHFLSLGVKEWTLYFKSTAEEDTLEEDKLVLMEDEEELNRMKEDETYALVFAMKDEWDAWLQHLPYPPALDQFQARS